MIQKKAEEYGIEDRIRFLGIRKDVAKLWKGMDIFVFPSLFEGLPVVGVEAQCNGLKCIFADNITRDVELTDIIEYEQNKK